MLFLDVASYEHELKIEGSELVFDLVSVSVKEVRLAWLDILFYFHWSVILVSRSSRKVPSLR